MGERAANRNFLPAERFDAATALRLGLLHDVVPAEALHDAADAICRTLCANGPDAVQASKRLVRDFAGQPIDTVLIADTVERIAACRSTDEAREGVAAFREQREPSNLHAARNTPCLAFPPIPTAHCRPTLVAH
ncbi:hypothetical protein G6F57_021964 [Rhizopus arrhizus]|nr:hypothetical protein G6F57_021964 [Rhizopus arrhizus]